MKKEGEKQKKKQLFPVHCSTMCGNEAVGSLIIAEKTSLPLCDNCRTKIDPDGKLEFVKFDEI